MRFLGAGVAALAAVLLVFLSLAASRATDPAFDEIAHVGAAYRLVLDGNDRLNPEHPPLVKWVAGVAMRACCATPARDALAMSATDQWEAGRTLLFGDGAPDRRLLSAARAPMLAIALFGLLGVWMWTRSLFGDGVAAVCALLYAASPTVVAQSALVLTDLPVGVFATWAMACAWLALHHAGRRALAAAAAAGAFAVLACLAKFSGVLVVPIVLATLALAAPRGTRARLLLAALVPLALAPAALGPDRVASLLEGFAAVGHNHMAGYAWYALGEFSLERRPWYFPLAFALKGTPSELLLLAGALPAAWRMRRRRDAVVVAAFPVAYFAAMVLLAPHTGQRYLAPVHPFVCVAAGFALAALAGRTRLLAATG
ncbi:MAG TPA: glycosyltransferase family 39 protein, partial [Xanthomonadales bacterium]|nr:glycosyltransferase family 39 protein [Xanthomonadales bacterium]